MEDKFSTGKPGVDGLITNWINNSIDAASAPLTEDGEYQDSGAESDASESELHLSLEPDTDGTGAHESFMHINEDLAEFGETNIESYLNENTKTWKERPSSNDWNTIRNEGSKAYKTWPMNMAIEYAFREFRAANAAVNVNNGEILEEPYLTKLLKQVVFCIRNHYSNIEGEKRVESSLVRTAKEACEKARAAYHNPTGTAGKRNIFWEAILPSYA
ncbi:hypothetical protein ACHAPO_004909 [Fusarium lateritium]